MFHGVRYWSGWRSSPGNVNARDSNNCKRSNNGNMVIGITAWIKEDLYPTLFDRIPEALPEHSWTQDRRGWRSKTYLDGSLHKDRTDKTKVLKASPGYIFEEGGDRKSLVDYVMERDRLPFMDAVKKLASVAGLEIPPLDIKDQESYQRAQQRSGVLEEAAGYMSWSLLHAKGKTADGVREYLQGRGYTMEDVEAMGLGYLPSWDQLKSHLVGKGHAEEAIGEALSIDKDGHLGTTHTLAIPYRTGSRIQGYVFRSVTGAQPKYLVTKGLDRKGGLFNLSPLKGTKDLVVVEGYLDALRATVMGLDNVVAVGAASLSPEQVQDAIAKGARKVTLCFDNDQGGKGGTEQALRVLKEFPQLKVYVAQLPEGKDGKMDPDQLITEQGVDAFRAVIDGAIKQWRYELNHVLGAFDGRDLTDKEIDQLKELAVVTATEIADPMDREQFTSAFIYQAQELGVTKESLDAVIEDLGYQRKKDQEKKALDSLLRSVGKDLDKGDPGAAIDRLGEGLQSLRAVRGADLLHPATYTGWLDRMRTAPAALRTGYASLDAIARIPQAAVTLVAGRPSHGKTLVMYNLLLSMAEVYTTKRFLFFTYEEPSEHILTKLLNSLLGVDLQHLYHEYEEAHTNYAYLKAYLRNGRTDVKEVEVAKDKLRVLLDSQRIQVVDGNYSVEDLDGILTGEVKKGPELGAVFLDYIQRMSTSRQTQDKRTEIAHISDQVLQIAKRTGLPLILGAQINRDAVAAKGSKPKLDNLKEAGNLEEDANLVLSVYNESREKDPPDGESWGRVVDLELCTLKNRDGEPNAKAVLSFDRWTGVVKDKAQTW